jgi:hypothetical protein
MFVAGALQPLPALVTVIEPLRRGRRLHLTTVRNEHAYYCCVAQVVRDLTYPLPVSPFDLAAPSSSSSLPSSSSATSAAATAASSARRVYVIGDSHCLSSAWSSVTSTTESKPTRVFVPRLVTGLKCWHLRDGCTFYTRRSLDYALRSIPASTDDAADDGVDVVFLFGEIDCREGLLVGGANAYAS